MKWNKRNEMTKSNQNKKQNKNQTKQIELKWNKIKPLQKKQNKNKKQNPLNWKPKQNRNQIESNLKMKSIDFQLIETVF